MSQQIPGNAEMLDRIFRELRSTDASTRNEAVSAAVGAGAAAVPGLLALLEEPGAHRAPAVDALSRLGDRRAAQAFSRGVGDADERVRAYSAQGLARLGDPAALAAAIRTLNDAADELHQDVTPSVHILGAMGLKAVSALFDPLLANDELTRLHAQRALEAIVSRRHGIVPGTSPSPGMEDALRAEWKTNGNYDYSADDVARARSVALWRQWLAQAKE